MRFNFHYNKPASLKAGRPILTVHFRGVCHLVSSVRCVVPCETKIRKQQPRCVMAGDCNRVVVSKGQALIL